MKIDEKPLECELCGQRIRDTRVEPIKDVGGRITHVVIKCTCISCGHRQHETRKVN